jgi:2-hydroxy-3-keto-5-methylthiopentenyl-1-phosphate phosphatase
MPGSTFLGPDVPPLAADDPPFALLIDYDGTIALTDVADSVMAAYVTGEWEAEAARYDAGLMGSRRLMDREMQLLRADPDALYATAADQPHDPTFVPFVEHAHAANLPVEVVSDGFGFYIAPALQRLGVPWIPAVSARTTFADGGATISYPNGHPRCFVCGTCKRNRVLAHRAAGRRVIFIGDGESDRYAAGYADVVFAKRSLVRICVDNGWPFERWTEFAEIDAWLAGAIDAWRADGSLPPALDRPFFCGPEVWGEGRWDPPAPPPGDSPRR